MIIKPAGPVPYSYDKAIPYRYNVVELEDGKEADTRRVDIADCDVRQIGNVVVAPNPTLVANKPATAVRTPVSAGQNGTMKEDCDEMLRLIKRSEYNVVDQLLQTPSKISVLS
ncbi:hypothetical protein KIW84_013324 [Lathyrus oleraceus]|uniref:Uncharacterized protein n=1 Tax=Pisum sativum TaxID=3888 RepID=A0A9D5BJQ2_PEA|nr:hypothetical protein KIW84_013324 [Pisum sativum]